MKHFIKIGLGLLVVVGLMLGTATETKAEWIIQVPTDLEAYRLDPVDFDITIDDATDAVSLDITLEFDTSVLEYLDTELGTVWEGVSCMWDAYLKEPGVLDIGVSIIEPLEPDPVSGTLIEIDFEVLGDAPFGLTHIEFTDFRINAEAVTGDDDGVVEIIPEPSSLLLLVIGALTLAFVVRRV